MEMITGMKQALLPKHLFQRIQIHGGCKKSSGKDKFVQKLMPSSYQME